MSEEELLLKIKSSLDDAGFRRVSAETRSIGDLAGSMGSAFSKAAKVGVLAIAGLGAGIAALGIGATKLTMDFDASLSELGAVSGASGEVMDELRAKALQIGKDTAFSAGQAANALVELSKAGLKTEQILGGAADATVALAAAGGIDIPQAAEIASAAMNQFGLAASELPHVADLLAGAANASATDVAAMGESLKNVGATAKLVGLDIDDTSTALAALAQIGITGGEAGSTLNRALLSLSAPSKEASDMMKQLGFNAFDAAGQLLPLPELAGNLRSSLEDLDPQARAAALSTMFSSFGLKAGAALFEQGAEGINKISESMKGVSAADVAKQKLDNLAGSVTIMKGSFETFLIMAGSAVQPILKGIVDAATGVINDGLMPLADAFQTGFDDAGGGFDGIIGGLAEVMAGLGASEPLIESVTDVLGDLRDKWADVTSAFNEGGVQAALEEVVGFDLQPLIDGFIGVGAAVVGLGKFMMQHKGIIIAVAVAYGALKTAMAINKAVESAAASIKAAQAAWTAYRAGTQGATLATTSFGTALKLAMGPIGWIVVAVGALYVAWKTNFGGIQEKTQAVVDWLKGVPATLAAGWNVIKGNLAQFGSDFKAAFVTVGEYAKSAVKVLLAIFFPLPLLFTKSGRDMVMGLWNGLKAQWDAMVNWVKGAAKRVVDSVKGVLKIQSPSRVFYDIGRWIMEGWSLGLVAGGPWVVRSAHMVMNDVLAALRDADAKVIGAEVAAAAAKAAVDAALAADGVVQGRRESAADAWGRFYDEQMDLEDALHERKMANLEAQAKKARKDHEDAKAAAIERIELQKRYIEGLLQQQRESEAKNGGASGPGGPPALKEFSDTHMPAVEAKVRDLIKFLDREGVDSLVEFWRAFHDGGQREIETAEELADVLAALADEVGKKYDELGEKLDAALEQRFDSEEARHQEVVRLLNERKALIDALIAAQADADADLADLIAARDKLLQQAQEAIRAAQDAAEEAEDRIHAGVMAHIDARRKAEEGAHRVRMDQLEDERGRLEVAHRERMRQLQEQRDKITEGFEARERQIDRERTALEQLKLDLGVERAIEKLVALQDKLAEIKAVIDSFEVAPRGRAAIEQRYKAMTERAKITTDAQRKALQDALASGTLNERDTRRVELLLAGRGTQRIEDLRRILGASADSLAQQASAQQQIVDFHANMIAIRERMIEMAETQLKIDQQNAADRLADIDKRIAAENDRHTREMAGIEAKIATEQRYFDGMMDFLDQLKDAEDERHAQRMADIAAEYALELAKLGMTQAEIDAMVSAAQREAERIAREVEEAWKKLQEEAEKAGALKPTDPKPQPGGPANGPSLEIKDVTVGEGTIDKVELGGITVKDTVVMVKLPSGRELAAEVIDTFIGDVALLDKFSARLNERAGANGQIRGGRP